MAPRLIVISNRVAVPVPGKASSAGGLVVAVKAALRNRPGVWFGWSGESCETPNLEPKIVEKNKTTYAVIDLSTADFQEYYNGFANRVLWPTLHYRVDLAEYTSADLGGYLRVNAMFADHVSRILRPDDEIWVHDYHLMPLARELRERGHENPIGFFLHIPCPPPDIVFTMPRHEDTVGMLAHYDLVGFQTRNDAHNFGRYLLSRGAVVGKDGATYEIDGRTTRIGAFPVGIETAVFARVARNAGRSAFAREFKDSLVGRKLMVGVDRLDYSKGLTQRLLGIERFLETREDWRSKFTFLQVTPTSRGDIKEYADIDRAVSEQVGHINGRYGEASWTPVRYINRSYSRATLAGIYRASAVALVTPLRDGMNLVAKEFIAAQDKTDPGVLILSRFAGAAAELDGAILINPHEAEAFPSAIGEALEMPLEERIARHAGMYRAIETQTIDRWARDFLTALSEIHKKSGLFEGIRALFSASK
jgi:trehalose 6-phosphate synthase